MPEEEVQPLEQNTAQVIFVEDELGLQLGDTKLKQLSPVESSRYTLKKELSNDKKQITQDVKKAANKAREQVKDLAREGNPKSVADINESLEIATKVDNVKTILGYEKKEAELEKIREELKTGEKGKEILLPGVTGPALETPLNVKSEG